jgi:septal ring factor EnvC (AmiA/AmiB activator)
MSESDATTQGQSAPQTEDQLQDRIIADAIGYTRGLVSVLDSLTEGFRRRGRELEEHKQRLTILQSERRVVLEERAGLEAQLRSLTPERDGLRTNLEERTREVAELRQELATTRETLEANARELQQLQAALATATRQAEELRQIVRQLERDNESKAQQIQSLGETQRELLQARESASLAQDAQVMIRERLSNTEELLDTARKQLSTSQQEMQALKTTLDEERTLTAALQEQLLSHRQDLSRLATLAQVFSMALTDIAGIMGIPINLADAGQQPDVGAEQLQGILQAVRGQAGALTESQEQIANLNALVESSREILGTKDALPDRLSELMAERQALERQLQESGLERQRLQEELAGSVVRAEQAREEAHRLSDRVNWLTAELEAQRAAAGRLRGAPMAAPEYSSKPVIPLIFPPAQAAEAAPEGQPTVKTAPAICAATTEHPVLSLLETAPTIREEPLPPVSSELTEPAAPSAAYWVECRIEGASKDTSDLFRGQPSRINEVGVVVPFHTSLSAGRVLIVRIIRGREEFSVRGSVVRAQPSKGTGGRKTGGFDHLIRFHHSNLESSRRLKAFLT